MTNAACSLVPRLSGTRNVHAWRAWYIFSRDHDVIKIEPEFLEQKGNILCVIQPALHSTLGVYDIHTPIAIYVLLVSFPLPSLFSLFCVFGYAHVQLRSFYCLSNFEGSHVRKNTRLSPHAQVQFLVPERRSLGTRLQVLGS